MTKHEIKTEHAPAAIGPYSQGIALGELAFISGQIPIDPATGEFAAEDAVGQARQCLLNIRAILAEGNMGMNSVVKTTVLLTDMADFAAVNEVYASFFTAPYPARACFQVAALPRGAKVEIEAIAQRDMQVSF
ncbi:MAG: RidA family protein [Christensenellaceae bacterium]|nr:RidA family protein [Christensenellaceae bacterium]